MEERIKREAMVANFLRKRSQILSAKPKTIKIPPPLPEPEIQPRPSLQSRGIHVKSTPYRIGSSRSPKLTSSTSPRHCRKLSPRRGDVHRLTTSPRGCEDLFTLEDTVVDVGQESKLTDKPSGEAAASSKQNVESSRPVHELLRGGQSTADPWQDVVPLGPQVQISTALLSSPPVPTQPTWFLPQPHQIHTTQHNSQMVPVPVRVNDPKQMWAKSAQPSPQWFF
jgi:hypothetical protein